MSENYRPAIFAILLSSTILTTAVYYGCTYWTSSKEIPVTLSRRRSKWLVLGEVQRGQRHTIEACVSDVESVREAIEGGVNSLELCSNRQEGGVTPSMGLIEEAVHLCSSTNVLVNVLIRPRPGNFNYTNEEFEIIVRDIIAARNVGVDGIVCGILTESGEVDMTRCKVIRQLCDNMEFTFHRAFDMCKYWEQSLEDIISLGCDRLLTSGLHETALQSCDNILKEIVKASENRIHIVAASGVNIESVTKIIKCSKVPGIHAGSGVNVTIESAPIEGSIMADSAPDMRIWTRADRHKVDKLLHKAIKAWNSLHIDK